MLLLKETVFYNVIYNISKHRLTKYITHQIILGNVRINETIPSIITIIPHTRYIYLKRPNMPPILNNCLDCEEVPALEIALATDTEGTADVTADDEKAGKDEAEVGKKGAKELLLSKEGAFSDIVWRPWRCLCFGFFLQHTNRTFPRRTM